MNLLGTLMGAVVLLKPRKAPAGNYDAIFFARTRMHNIMVQLLGNMGTWEHKGRVCRVCLAILFKKGNNRQICFFAEDDYQFYLHCLEEASRRHHVAVHAYVLKRNHVHLLVTPDNDSIETGDPLDTNGCSLRHAPG